MAARPATGAGRAARALGVVGGVAPQLEGDGGRVRAAAQRGDGGVDAAAHGHQRALGVGRRVRIGGHRPAEGARKRVGGELGGVELAGAQAAQGIGDRVRCRPARRRGAPLRARARRRRCPLRVPRRSPRRRSRRRTRGRPGPRRRCARGRRRGRRRPPASWAGTRPRPTGWLRCSSKRSSGTRPV
jgi:hypothetical protein